MKINLGSGNKYREGWVNVDLHSEKVDQREDIRTVWFPAGNVDQISFIHVIEHLTSDEGVAVLKNCFTWLKRGGTIEVESPDVVKCEKLLKSTDVKKILKGAKGIMGGRTPNKKGWHDWLLSVWMEDVSSSIPKEWDIPGEEHKYVWYPDELQEQMQRIGFLTRTELPRHHGKRKERDFRVIGAKL